MDPLPARRFAGLVYRAHNPRWAYARTSGEGAARHGGGFDARGTPALFTALDPKTAEMEAQQGMSFKAQPLTLVACRVDCERVVDLTAPAVQAALGLAEDTLACPWEDLEPRCDTAHLDFGQAAHGGRTPGHLGAQLCPRHRGE